MPGILAFTLASAKKIPGETTIPGPVAHHRLLEVTVCCEPSVKVAVAVNLPVPISGMPAGPETDRAANCAVPEETLKEYGDDSIRPLTTFAFQVPADGTVMLHCNEVPVTLTGILVEELFEGSVITRVEAFGAAGPLNPVPVMVIVCGEAEGDRVAGKMVVIVGGGGVIPKTAPWIVQL